jgi:eukaryotic-like serine/threonine-protein kinase
LVSVGEFPLGFGRYQLVERLAMGGMAELFVATSPGEHGFQKRVVIKRLLPNLVHDETYNAMFIDEAKLTAKLVHPKIAQTFELGKVDETLYIAMEHVEGIDVLALLREYAAKRRRVEPHLAAWIAHEVLDALDYAHNLSAEDGSQMGVVHRDISPSNVLMSVRGDIKLVDFGIARAADPERAHKSKSGTLKGKYGYMSPEQVIEQPLDARSDLFSVGVVFAELLTGRRLFAAANELDVLLMVRDAKLSRLDKYGADLDPDLSGILRKALSKPLNERWQSAAIFRDALAEWLFEHRHRMTNKHVADVVNELHPTVIARRNKPPTRPPVMAEAEVLVPPDDGAPIGMVDDGPSMPVISVSYDDRPARPLSSTDMQPLEPPMPDLPRPPMGSESRKPMVVSTESPRNTPMFGVPPVKVQTPAHGIPRTISANIPPLSAGVVEIPIGDTISAAVEAITMPELDSGAVAFDDLTEPPAWRDSPPERPSPEEAMRKKPPTPPTIADISEPADDSGDFALTSPLRVLFRLMTARATGLLGVAVGGIKKEIYVRDGQPEYVSSNVASELFGNYLVTKGVLSDGELAMALAMMPHYGGKLGDTLVGLGLMKPLEVFRHLTRQVRTKIIDVCTWNRGSFAWYAGRENPREAFPLDFNAFEILGAGAMALSDDHIETWIAKNGSMKLRASRTRRVGPERFEVKGLVKLCDLLDGHRSVSELVEQAPDRSERLRAGRMLCLLEQCDLARPT